MAINAQFAAYIQKESANRSRVSSKLCKVRCAISTSFGSQKAAMQPDPNTKLASVRARAAAQAIMPLMHAQCGKLLRSRLAAKNTRHSLSHQAPSARLMSGKLVEYMLGLCRSAPKRPQEGIEVISPRRALAPNELPDSSRTSSDCSRVDHRADGQDWCQKILDKVQAEVDDHVLHYRKIIAAKNKTISDLKRQLASSKKQLG